MVMEGPPEINPPSSRVPGQELLQIPISGSRWRRNSGKNVERESSLRVFGTRGKYRHLEGHQGVAHLARRPGGAASPWPRQVAAWPGGSSPVAPFGLPEASDILEFLEFFWNFLAILIFHLFLRCTDNNRQKLALGTRLIG